VKNLRIFYLIFMVLLSIMPCGDEFEPDFSSSNKISKISHSDTQNSNESCSPICLCTCCGQSIVKPSLAVFQIQIPFIQLDKNIPNTLLDVEQRARNIWQPPKLILI
jgi:hypothetical protein